MTHRSALLVAAVSALAAAPAFAQTVTVTSPAVKSVPAGGAEYNDTPAYDQWLRDNVRQGSSVGIDGTYAHGGNGSVHLTGTLANSSKADLEYYFGGAVLSPFTLGSLQSASYQFYRSSSSTTAANQNPALRFFVDADGNMNTTNDRGYLVYEGANNGETSVPTNVWNTETIGATSNVWFRQFTPGYSDYCAVGNCTSGIGRPLAAYQSYTAPNGAQFSANSVIYGLSFGIGSGWSGTYDGAVDNVSVTLAGATPRTVTFNFEQPTATVTPEPASIALVGAGLFAVGAAARRRRPRA